MGQFPMSEAVSYERGTHVGGAVSYERGSHVQRGRLL